MTILLLASAALSTAATKKWDAGAANGDWVSGLNWNPDNVPAPGDDIALDATFGPIPASMVINGGVVNAQTLTFAPGFNATSTTLIGNGSSIPSYLVLAGTAPFPNPLVQVNSTSGTVTFDRRNGGTADLNFELGAASTMDVHSGATLNIHCEISGPYGLTKAGAGTLKLGGTNLYTGATTVNQGTLALVTAGSSLGSVASSSAISVNAGATLDVSGVSFTVQPGQILAGNGSISGNVSAAAGATILAGPAGVAGTLTLSNSLTLAGATVVFDLANVTTEGAGVNDELVVSGNLTLTGNNVIMLNYLTGSLAAGSYKVLKYAGSKSGSFVLGAPYQNVTLDETTTPNYVVITVGASGSSVLNLKWQGDGGANVWDLVTPANWMNGANPTGYYDPANVIMDDSGSTSPSINLVTKVDPRSLTVNSIHDYTITGTGQIGSIPGLNNALIKSGSGTLTLETSNDFAAGVDIQAGTLRIGNVSAIPSGPGRGDVSVAGTLDLNGNSIVINGLNGSGAVDNQSGSGTYTLTLGSNNSSGTFSGVIRNTSGTLGLSKIGSGTLTLSGNNTFSGAVTVNDGALRVAQNNALGNSVGGTTVAGAGALGRLELIGGITVNENVTLSMKFGIGSGTKDLQVPHIQNISGDNTLNGTFTLNSGGTFWTFQSDAGRLILTKPLSSTATGPRPLLLQGAGDGEIRGPIQNGSGQIALVKSGSGTWTLSGTNTYTQNTTINTGTLRLNSANSIPNGSGKGDIAVDGTLDLNGNSITLNGLSGAGVVDNGSGAGLYVLTIGDNNRSGTFSGVVRNNSGTVAVSKIGTGTITLGGANLYSGNTTISQGTLKLGASNVLPDGAGKGNVILNGILDLGGNSDTINGLSGSGSVDNTAGGTPTLTVGNNNTSSVFDGAISGGFVSLSKVGSGTLTLNGTHAFSGNTAVAGGSLMINSDFGSPLVTVNSGATLGGYGLLSGSVIVESGGTLAPGPSIATLVILDTLTLAGNTVMEINKTGGALSSDFILGPSSLSYGGTLTVSATGDALADNDTFNLFAPDAYSGAFTTFNLPSLQPCLVWDTSKLSVDGSIKVTHETVSPTIGTITVIQSGPINVKNCANSLVQGTVNIAVQASDNCSLAAPPVVALTNGANNAAAAFVNESPAGTFNYTWIVTAGTAGGTWTATTTATDSSGNATRSTFTLCLAQQFQVTGQIEPQGFIGTTRAVTFVVTSSSNTPLLTNTQTLTFSGTPRVASYTLSVPLNAANLSSKTAWTLRKRLPLTFSSGQAVANFTGTARLQGGDLSGDNRVNTTDNNIFKTYNGRLVSTTPAAAQADLTGDGRVNTSDYNVLKSNLGKIGEAQ